MWEKGWRGSGRCPRNFAVTPGSAGRGYGSTTAIHPIARHPKDPATWTVVHIQADEAGSLRPRRLRQPLAWRLAGPAAAPIPGGGSGACATAHIPSLCLQRASVP
jgi:hypothetical protein